MGRLFLLVFLLVGALTALSCTDQGSAPTESDQTLAGSKLISQCTDPVCTTIQRLINAVYPNKGGKTNNLNSAANSQWASIQKSCLVKQNVTDCQEKVFALIDFGNDMFADGKLSPQYTCTGGGCPTPAPESTEEALNLLNISLLQSPFGGFSVPTPDPDVAPEDVVIEVCDPAQPCAVVPESGEFGSFLAIGACDGPCAIVGQKIDESQFEPGEGPLTDLGLTDHKQYPVFVDWSKGEAGGQGSFNFPIEVATCVIDDGPNAPPDLGALKLAHPHPTIPGAIEFAEDNPANNVVLDCGALSAPSGGLAPAAGRRLSLARASKLSGAISSFSPVVATDTLPPGTSSGSISGTVTDVSDSQPVPSATVELLDGSGEETLGTTTTNASGDYSFSIVTDAGPSTDYVVQASATGYDTNSTLVTLTFGEDETGADIALTPVSSGFASVSAGFSHSCGVTAAGAAYCWGDNDRGGLGNGTTSDSNVPVAVSGSYSFASVSAGYYHSCGVTTAGAAYCWGENDFGGLGDGTITESNVPVAVSGSHTFAAVSAGFSHSCGVTTAGAAYCWGYNGSGQLGNGTGGANTSSNVPVAVSGSYSFASVSTGFNHSCGVTTAGTAYCWGNNDNGMLGDGTTTHRYAPVAVSGSYSFASVSAGHFHSCGVTTAGAAHCWGFNGFGEFGDGTTTNSSVPVAVSGSHTFAFVIVGLNHSCGVTTAGAVYCWGYNGYGQLGNGTNTNSNVPVAVSGSYSLASGSAGDHHVCGVTTAGAAYCWGRNASGELGNGTNTNSNVPVAVSLP